MADGTGSTATRGTRALAIAYLVWHCCSSVITIAPLIATTLAYAGMLPVATTLSATVTVLGAAVSVWVVLVVGWVVIALFALAGVIFAIDALRACTRPEWLGRAVVLGRVMFALCLLETLLAFVQGNALLGLGTAISTLLAGSLALEVRRVESQCAAEGRPRPHTPRRSFVVDASQRVPEREADVPAPARPFFRLLSGYATTMLVWGVLRALMGLSTLFSTPTQETGVVSHVVAGLLVIGSAAYLIVTGRLGKRALFGGSSLHTFFIVDVIGLALSLAALIVYVAWFVGGWAAASQDIFSAALDVALLATGCFYANRLSRALAAARGTGSLPRNGQGGDADSASA